MLSASAGCFLDHFEVFLGLNDFVVFEVVCSLLFESNPELFHGEDSAFLESLRERIEEADEVEDVIGVVLFGSVARGTADRGSDIDLLIIIDGTHTYGRRIANRAARNVEEQTFDGDRYEFEVLVETPESASDYGSKLREILDEGLILERSNDFTAVRSVVHADLSG